MGFWSSDNDQQQCQDAYNQCNDPNTPTLSHELIAGAASYEAAKAYENHEAANGETPSHEKAKELIAAATGAYVDRLAETKGADAFDSYEAKRQAQQMSEQQIAPQYGY